MSNISLYHNITTHVYFIKKIVKKFNEWRNTYRNYIPIIASVILKKYPITVVLKNGKTLSLNNYRKISFIAEASEYQEIQYDIDNDVVVFSIPWNNNSSHVTMYGAIENGDIVSIFFKGEYHSLPVSGKTVVDIGANIGDSAIYFALKGANRIVGIEPFLYSHNLAIKNIKINNLQEKITLVNAVCSNKNDFIIVDPNYRSSVSSKIQKFQNGTEIPVFTLQQIINNYVVPHNSLLKIDCEGCEYDILFNESKKIVRLFTHIIIEYHKGYKNLKTRLERLGFNVSITNPIRGTGLLFAVRQ